MAGGTSITSITEKCILEEAQCETKPPERGWVNVEKGRRHDGISPRENTKGA